MDETTNEFDEYTKITSEQIKKRKQYRTLSRIFLIIEIILMIVVTILIVACINNHTESNIFSIMCGICSASLIIFNYLYNHFDKKARNL